MFILDTDHLVLLEQQRGLECENLIARISDEDKPGIILDYDIDGIVVGLEVLNATQRVENPRGVDYAVTG